MGSNLGSGKVPRVQFLSDFETTKQMVDCVNLMFPEQKNAGDPLRHGGCKRKLTKSNYHENSSVRSQLQGILANLGPECPFFLKSMMHCNVVHGFSLTLPKQFCYLYLSFDDTTITLEDERGKEYRTVYLGDKRRLSGGWRGFCVAMNLVLGDLLVFHLVGPLKFKKLTRTMDLQSLITNSNKQKKFKRATEDSLYETSEAQFSVLERAKKVATCLDPQFPTMVKVMLPSHVSGCLWLGLPRTFCDKHLPKQDTMFVLEDETVEKFDTKYLVEKIGLSGGWRGFSISHKLIAGDVLVFHLVEKSKFKVYIIRSNGLGEVECALSLVQLDAGIGDADSAHTNASGRAENVIMKSFKLVENSDGDIQRDRTTACYSKHGSMSDLSENDMEDTSCELYEGFKVPESDVPLKEVPCMRNFDVIYDGSIINPLFPKPLLSKYYELCCSQNSFLHEHLLQGLNKTLVAGIISETTNIAAAIKASKITTSESSLSTWDKTLQACEMLGMNVGFLRERIEQLASLVSKLKMCEGARLERKREEEEIRSRLAKLLEVKKKTYRLESRISVKLKSAFKEVLDATW